MPKKYLIFGADGQLGSELRSQLDKRQLDGEDVRYAAVDVDRCDITDAEAVGEFFEQQSDGDVVLNAAAYTAVDAAEQNREKAMAVNGVGAGLVAAAAREHGMALIHFSTDFVFGDGYSEPIDEMEEPEPLSVYGRTKLAGERLALQNNPATAVLRTSGLYSRWGGNFVDSIARYAREREKLQVVSDQYVGPTPVVPLAQVALKMGESPQFMGGIYHATVQGECTWYQFARKIVELLELDTAVEATTAREWGADARRPEYSVLDNRRLRLRGLDEFGSWDEELEAFFARKARE